MKKRGFTLIELLAVIVILAIIALIAVPSVLNVIEDSRQGAAEASARNIMNAAKTYYMESTMKGTSIDGIDLTDGTMKYDGAQAEKGYVSFDENGKTTTKMYINGYCVEIDEDGNVSSEKVDEASCEAEMPAKIYEVYATGKKIYYDPVRNVKCTEAETLANENAFLAANYNSLTTLKSGCMTFYAFLDDENSSKVKLLIDHNLTWNVFWKSSSTATEPDESTLALQNAVSNWNANVKNTARMISIEEIHQIAPSQLGDDFDPTLYSSRYYFHNGLPAGTSENAYGGPSNPAEAGTNKYAWLFTNLSNCEMYGCLKQDSGDGYWTSSVTSEGYAWKVGPTGSTYGVFYNVQNGIRPVIEVSKNVLK